VLLVCLMTWYNPVLFAASSSFAVTSARWLDIVVWGGVLMVIVGLIRQAVGGGGRA